MLMNDKIIFYRYHCINSAKTEQIMVHYILQPCHIFIRVKAFILILAPGAFRFSLLACFAWRQVASIIKCCVLTACAHVNRKINK